MPLKVVQTILGHGQIGLTADTYTHVLPELQADAAARQDALLGRLEATALDAPARDKVERRSRGGRRAPPDGENRRVAGEMGSGPSRIRTCNLGIMSSLLCP